MEIQTIPKTTVLSMYVIYDTLTEESSPLYEAPSDISAIRAFCPLLAETVNVEDYKLYKVGTFDRHSLAVCSCGVPQEIDYMPYFLNWLEKNVQIKEVKK